MYYDTVELRPSGGKWVALHSPMKGDRHPQEKYEPNALGFFHYPRKWGREKGFRLLKKEMIKRHESEINALKKSLKHLRLAELGENQLEGQDVSRR